MSAILMSEFFGKLLFGTILGIPFVFMGINIYSFVVFFKNKKDASPFRVMEVIAIFLGIVYLFGYVTLTDILFVPWNAQLYNTEKHSMVAPDAFFTILVLSGVAVVGYLALRFIPAQKQPPIVSALCIAAVYLGIGVCVAWCVQTYTDIILLLFPLNCVLVFIKSICITVYQKNNLIQTQQVHIKYTRLANFLNKATNLPWLALILVVPLLGVIIAVLFVLGQEPSSIIKAWTETSGWTFSQKTAPQNIYYDQHYLCTVAAGGHKKVVKPIRAGRRHGHQVVVNRQLCVANAFEQVLEEKLPTFHKTVRKIYDTTGYPISRHIRSPYLADAIYFIMKPLEWLFLLVLYTVDVNPEDRIAVQYPHAQIPGRTA